MFGPCFDVQHLMSYLVLQSFHLETVLAGCFTFSAS